LKPWSWATATAISPLWLPSPDAGGGSFEASPEDLRSESAVASTADFALLWSGAANDPENRRHLYGRVLKPTRGLSLKDNQRVRLTVETIDDPSRDRQAAIGRLKAGIESMRFFSEGPLPSREELHDRR
jgi:hypothetical protein